MRLSRTNLVPVLTIVAGGTIGAFLTISPLVLWSPSDDVPAPDPVVTPFAPAKSATRVALKADRIGVPAVSPDGRWLAYISDETGTNEVYVTSFPNMDSGRWQVSTDGGVMTFWTRSGRELFYVDSNGGLIVAQFDTDSGFQVGETLFTLPPGYVIGVEPEN